MSFLFLANIGDQDFGSFSFGGFLSSEEAFGVILCSRVSLWLGHGLCVRLGFRSVRFYAYG
jgi:hypothetical protein